MEAITLTINDQTISTRAGRTILEVAREQGIHIPTICHHDLLRPIGACRLCQVELSDRGVVVPACVTQVAQGMVIQTHSQRVIRNRRNIVRLIMAAHPESCLVCEKGNNCVLRNLAAQLGVGHHGLDPMSYHPTVQDINPFLARDLSKCILCAKCIRADQEVVVEGVIDYHRRGFDAHPATLSSLPLENSGCTFCGTCLSVCPVGAIYEKNKVRIDHGGARSLSVCGFCACGCTLELEHDHQRVVGVRPAGRAHDPNGISLCVKGHFGFDYLVSPQRLTRPLLRREDGFQFISWDQALELMAEKFAAAARRPGPRSLAFLGGSRSSNEENYLFQKLARAVLGSPNLDSLSRAYWYPAAEVLHQATGFAAGSTSLAELERASVLLVVGADPTQSAPVMGYHLKRAVKAGAELILVDPVEGRLAGLAGQWLRVSPGGDEALLMALLKIILDQGLSDRKYVDTKTTGFKRLVRALEEVDPAACARAAGVPLGRIRRAAQSLAGAQSAVVVFGGGVMQQPRAAQLVRLLLDLALVTGNLGRQGAGVIPLLRDCNTQGALDMGLHPRFWPGHQRVGDKAARRRLEDIWGAPPPARPGLDLAGMLAAAEKGRLKAMYILGEDPVGVLPRSEKVARALEQVPFLVVQDLFMSPTARLADLVLPAAGFAEKEGSFTNLERRVQALEQAVLPPGDFPGELEVLERLAGLLGASWDYGSARAVHQELERAAPIYQGVLAESRAGRAAFWPLLGVEGVTDTLPHGIGLPGGKARLPIPEPGPEPGVPPRKGYPYILMQGQIHTRLASGVRASHSPRLQRLEPRPWLGVSPADCRRLKLKQGDRVRVRSAQGGLELAVRPQPGLPRGVLFVPAGYPGAGLDRLGRWEDGGKNLVPAAKHCRVSLRKL